MNDVIDQVNTEEDLIYDIVDDIISTENRISELTNKMLINDDSGPGLAKFNLKHDIIKNISTINSLTSQIEDSKIKFKSAKAEHELQIKQIEEESKTIENKIKSIANNTSSKEDLYRLSFEKIEEIIAKKKNDDDLKATSLQINTLNSSRNGALTSLEDLISQRDEVISRMLMLKEERQNSKDYLNDMISTKESLEEIAKMIINVKGFNPRDIEVFFYEIKRVDITKVAKEIGEGIHSMMTSEESNNDIDERAKINGIVQNEMIDIVNFDDTLITSYKVGTFISGIANKIIAGISNSISLFYSIQRVVDYIKYIIKINYYDCIIINEINFIDKDSKAAKKELKRTIEESELTISKLKVKINEFHSQLSSLKQKENVLIENKAKSLIYLSPEEKEYIRLNEKANFLLKKKKEQMTAFESEEIKFNNEIALIQNKVDSLIKENKLKEMQIERIDTDIKYQKGNVNNEIINLRKEIADKFRLIKAQLALFKKKHGDTNMDLYNKLVQRINRTLKMTSKTMLNLNYSSLSNRNVNSNFLNNTTVKINPLMLSQTSSMSNRLMLSQSASMTNLSNIEMKKTKRNPLVLKSRNDQKEVSGMKNIEMKNNSNKRKGLWEEEQNKLSMSIKQLKSKIISSSKTNIKNNVMKRKTMSHDKLHAVINDINIYNKEEIKIKLSSLISSYTSCYMRYVRETDLKFNPLYHSKKINEMGFIKASIKIDDIVNSMIITTKKSTQTIPIEDVESTIVNNNIKYLIKIHQRYKHYKGKMSVKEFVKLKELEDIPMNENDISKAAMNEIFNFRIKIKGYNQRIELIMCEYDDIKRWLNGLGFLINHKMMLVNIRKCFI